MPQEFSAQNGTARSHGLSHGGDVVNALMEALYSRPPAKFRPKSPRPELKKLAGKPIPPPPQRELAPQRPRAMAITALVNLVRPKRPVPSPFDPLGIGLSSEARCGLACTSYTSNLTTSMHSLASSYSLPSSSRQNSVPWPLSEVLQVEAIEAKADRIAAEAFECRLGAEKKLRQTPEVKVRSQAMKEARQQAEEESILAKQETKIRTEEVPTSSPSSRTPRRVEESRTPPVTAPPLESITPLTLHTFSTEQLRLIASSKGLPRAGRMERTHLQENIRQVLQWEKTCTEDLVKAMKSRGCPIPPGGSRDGIINVLID